MIFSESAISFFRQSIPLLQMTSLGSPTICMFCRSFLHYSTFMCITTSSSQSVSPVAAGNTTKSSSDGFNTYNYFLLDVHSIAALTNINYNGALAVEKDFLTRYEFYRLILNSNRKKCGRWVNADAYTAGAFTDEVVADEHL